MTCYKVGYFVGSLSSTSINCMAEFRDHVARVLTVLPRP
jgi:hypothetical protein